MKWSLISAVNNDQVLQSCLLKSEDAKSATEVILQRGYPSAALAYNNAIEQAQSDILVFAHQDVYLPKDWIAALGRAIERLNSTDPAWAVLGVYGVRKSGDHVGHVYCAGVQRILGQEFADPQLVSSLDELLLIVRKSSGVRFDERIGGYHFYGTDICLEAQRRGFQAYAISALCIHNTNGYKMLPAQFWRNFFLVRRKWWDVLPVTTSCMQITRSYWPMIRWNIGQAKSILLKQHHPGKRVADPAELYRQLNLGGVGATVAP